MFGFERQKIRDLVLLEDAAERATRLTDVQREVMRAYSDAGNCRLQVAQDVRGPKQTPVALGLYRQAWFFHTLAFLVSREKDLDVASVTPETALEKLSGLVATAEAPAPPEFERVRPLLLSSDPLEFDRLSNEEAELRAQEFETTSQWLRRLYDTRSPRQIQWARAVRMASAAASGLALLVLVAYWIFSPKNLARGKQAAASSFMFSTVAEGAVDGSKSGRFGYHSQLEESPWLSVDLGRRYAITTAKVFGRGDTYQDQSIPLAFEVSDDNVSYREVARRTEPFSADDPWIIKPTGVLSRFIRLRTMRQSYLVLSEVEVYGQKSK